MIVFLRKCVTTKIISNDEGYDDSIPSIELIFALIENLCTLNELFYCNDNVMQHGFKSGIILNILRKKKYDVMKYFRINQKFPIFMDVQESQKTLSIFCGGSFGVLYLKKCPISFCVNLCRSLCHCSERYLDMERGC